MGAEALKGFRLVAGVAVALVLLSACSPEVGGDGESPQADGRVEACEVGAMPLREPGRLIVAADLPGSGPWIVGEPTDGQGFEAALVYEVAGRLGLDREMVRWMDLPYWDAFARGEKPFDLFVGRVVDESERETEADLSHGYFRVDQAVLARANTTAAAVVRLTGLRPFRLGSLVGQRGLALIDTVIRPRERPFAYQGLDQAMAALAAGEVDAVLMDLPRAVAATAADPGLVVVGRVVTGQRYVLVFPSGSGLRRCANEALATIRADGTLRSLFMEWLGAYRGVPVLPT